MPKPNWTTGVYSIKNRRNGKLYIGSASRSIRNRLREHLRLLRLDQHPNRHLQSAWNKHGHEAFVCTIVEWCSPDECLEREQYWMDLHKSGNDWYGYNICPTAISMRGYKHTEASRAKMRETQGRIKSGTQLKGRKFSDETRRLMSVAKKGKPSGRKGAKHSDETKRILSEKLKKIMTPEYRAILSQRFKTYHERKRAERAAQTSTTSSTD